MPMHRIQIAATLRHFCSSTRGVLGVVLTCNVAVLDSRLSFAVRVPCAHRDIPPPGACAASPHMDDAALPVPVDEELPVITPAAAPSPPTEAASTHEQAAAPSHDDATAPDASVPPAVNAEAAGGTGQAPSTAAAPASAEALDPGDEWNVDLSDPGWTYDRLLAAAQLSANGYDWVEHSVLTRDHLVRATADPRPDLDLAQPKLGGAGGGRKASTKGRLVADVVEEGKEAFVTALASAVELPAGACMAMFQGVEINLERLFHIVAAHGGSDAVRVGRQWTAVADAVTPATSAPTRGLVHRQAYETLLLGYEQLLDARGEYAPLCVRCKAEHSDVVEARRAAAGARGRPRKGSGQGAASQRSAPNACEVCSQRHSGIVWLFQCDWCERTLCQTCGFGDEDDSGPDGQKAHKCMDCAKGDTNRAFCEACRGETGELHPCHSCPASYHAACVEGPPPAGEWLCPSCMEGGNEAADAVEALALMDASGAFM
jgi:hypothetical protein